MDSVRHPLGRILRVDSPLRPSLLRLRDAIDSLKSSSECLLPVSIPETSTCSHSTGTLSALKISLTDSDTSAPTPSPVSYLGTASYFSVWCLIVPGMRVTVYFPPNFVGLKMSWPTVVAIAVRFEFSVENPIRTAFVGY